MRENATEENSVIKFPFFLSKTNIQVLVYFDNK